MSRLAPARAAALASLMEAATRGCYVRDVLGGSSRVRALDARDAGMARRLALGVTAAQGCLDELLDVHLARPGKVSPRVRMALRISSFELLYLGTAPEVAVSQGVELVRSVATGATGLANAVLRRVAEGARAYLAAEDAPRALRPLTAAARGAGLPVWLAQEIQTSLGDERAGLLFDAALDPAPFALHLNPVAGAVPVGLPSASVEQGKGASGQEALLFPGCVCPPDAAAVISSGILERGEAVVSDMHAQLIATIATRPGSCLEVGAGRGTKTFVMMSQAARLGFNHGPHVALDLSSERSTANRARLERAGMGRVQVLAGDGRALSRALAPLDAAEGRPVSFDTVFVDAPCSGTGTMRRHPEIPWRLQAEDVADALPALQGALLSEASRRVAPGGELIYATCSVMAQENEQVVNGFLESAAGAPFHLAPVSRAIALSQPGFSGAAGSVRAHETAPGFFQAAPARHGFDGHFCARFVRG